MAIVHIRISGREYQVACDDGQEQQLQFLASTVDERMKTLLHGMRTHPGEVMALLLTSLMMADERHESKKERATVAAEVQRLAGFVNEDRELEHNDRRAEIENAMANTLEEIAMRIERIADRVEVR